jgi:hypothetical protein
MKMSRRTFLQSSASGTAMLFVWAAGLLPRLATAATRLRQPITASRSKLKHWMTSSRHWAEATRNSPPTFLCGHRLSPRTAQWFRW